MEVDPHVAESLSSRFGGPNAGSPNRRRPGDAVLDAQFSGSVSFTPKSCETHIAGEEFRVVFCLRPTK
jgi:hypothetical protein